MKTFFCWSCGRDLPLERLAPRMPDAKRDKCQSCAAKVRKRHKPAAKFSKSKQDYIAKRYGDK